MTLRSRNYKPEGLPFGASEIEFQTTQYIHMKNLEEKKGELLFLQPLKIENILAYTRRARVLMQETKIAYHFSIHNENLGKALPALYQAWLDDEEIEVGVNPKDVELVRAFRFKNGKTFIKEVRPLFL